MEFDCCPFCDVEGSHPQNHVENIFYGSAPHPAVNKLRDCPFESVKILAHFTDDHLPCLDVEAVIDGEIFQFAMCWLDTVTFRLVHRALESSHSQEALRSFILEREDESRRAD